MCHADTTPLVWQWDPDYQVYVTNMAMNHTCRDWDGLYAWAGAHQAKKTMDRFTYVPGSPHWPHRDASDLSR